MSCRALVDALRLRALAFTAALAGLFVVAVASLALLFAPIPSATTFRAPLHRAPPAPGGPPTAPTLTLGATAPSSQAELQAPRPAARAAARPSADRGHRSQLGGPLPDVTPTSLRAAPLVRFARVDLDRSVGPSARVARVECLRSAIVCSPRETRAPPLG